MGRTSKILTEDGDVIIVSLSKSKAIKHKCFECQSFKTKDVKECKHKKCNIYPYRLGKNPHDGRTRSIAVREYCTWCMNGVRHEVRKCTVNTCPLFSHRIGAESENTKKLKREKRK
jgi:hypothetical protein